MGKNKTKQRPQNKSQNGWKESQKENKRGHKPKDNISSCQKQGREDSWAKSGANWETGIWFAHRVPCFALSAQEVITQTASKSKQSNTRRETHWELNTNVTNQKVKLKARLASLEHTYVRLPSLFEIVLLRPIKKILYICNTYPRIHRFACYFKPSWVIILLQFPSHSHIFRAVS